MGLLDLELMLNEAVHPKDVVILSLQLKLVADEETQLLLCLVLEFPQGLLEDCVELFFDEGGFRVDLFYLQVDLAQIVGQLILSAFDVRIDFFNL